VATTKNPTTTTTSTTNNQPARPVVTTPRSFFDVRLGVRSITRKRLASKGLSFTGTRRPSCVVTVQLISGRTTLATVRTRAGATPELGAAARRTLKEAAQGRGAEAGRHRPGRPVDAGHPHRRLTSATRRSPWHDRAVGTVADLDLPALNYADPALAGPRFHETLRSLRERSWVARAEPFGFFVLDREATAFFLRTPAATFPGRTMLEIHGITSGPLYERMKGNLLDRGGEEHRRLRRQIQPAFTPKAADAYRPAMREQLADLFGAIEGAGRCEVVADLAKPYPARMIATVMGAPLEDAPRLQEWANTIQRQFDPDALTNDLPTLERAAVEFQAYARELIAARSGALIGELLDAGLTEDETLDVVSSVLVGGVDTTQSQLAHGLRLFAAHPEQWALLAERPDLAPAAVEEILRFEPIAPFTARITTEEIAFRDVVFPASTLVFACAQTANRDPGEYEEPEAFDIRAERGKARPLTFGAGPHFCLGASLARAELDEALRFLAPRMPGLAPDGEPEYDTPLGLYGLKRLPLRWG
jgi:cytochrome P450